jgi:GT2 family glycosyltransferase
LKGKKALCFIALKHHGRYLFPVTRILEAQGMEIIYPTAPAESPFEITFIEEGLPYRHTYSYLNPEVARDTEAAYRQLRSVWKDKILEGSILHYFSICIQDKGLRMHIENFYLLRRMFEVERPDLVLVLHEMNSWGKILGYLCHEFGVPFVSLQEGLYYGDSGIYRFNTEYSTGCLVWGESTREVLLKAGGCDDKIFIVGNTHLPETIREHQKPEVIRKTKKELGVRKGGRMVTLFMGGLGYGETFELPDSLLAWVKATPDLTLAIKWHPFNNKKVLERISERFVDLPNVRSLQQYDTYNLLAASDVCVLFGNSTTGLETLAFDKPLVEVFLNGQAYCYSELGVAERALVLGDVPAVVEKIFRDGVPAERKARVEEFLRYNLCSRDGKSVDRTIDAITRVLSASEAQKSRAAAKTAAPSSADGAAQFDCSVIVSFTSIDPVLETLVGVADHTPSQISYECILSANLSPAETESLREIAQGDIRLVSSSSSGIASLCNAAAKKARGRYLCVLPAGVIPQSGWLEAMMKAMEEDDRVGIVGGRVVYSNGLIAHAGIAFDANFSALRLYRLLPGDFLGACKTRNMRAVADCLLIRRECWESAGGMDETIESYLFEVDFCLQARSHGWEVLYEPQSLFLSLNEDAERREADRLWFYGKWMGLLWPDEERYWQEDGVTQERLLELYSGIVGPESSDPQVAAS